MSYPLDTETTVAIRDQYLKLLCIVLTICLLTGESTLNFENQRNLQFILVSYLLSDYWLICRLQAQCMISKSNVRLSPMGCCVCPYFFKTMYNKTIIRSGSANNTYLDCLTEATVLFSTKAGFSTTTLCPALHTDNFVLDYITDWTLWSTYSRSTNQFTNTFFLQKKLWYTTLWIHCLRLTQSPSPQDLLHPNRTRKDRLGHNSLKNFTSNREQRVLGHKE